MILYSIIPPEIVFADLTRSTEKNYIDTEYMGEKILVERNENNSFTVVRVLSTNPRAYLNPVIQPGNIINDITRR